MQTAIKEVGKEGGRQGIILYRLYQESWGEIGMNAQVSCFDVNNKTTKLLPYDLFNLPGRYVLEKKKTLCQNPKI